MPIRRFNYTQRQRIEQSDARITLHEPESGFATFDAALNLKPYELPEEALVFVEAYRQTTRMRFAFGTAGHIEPLSERILGEFDTTDGVLFRVCVSSTAQPQGMLLAEADQIQPRLPEAADDNRLPLLAVKPDDDLGHQVWSVDFSGDPILLVNSKLGDYHALSTSPAFIALVLPAALREILMRTLLVEKHTDTEDLQDWRSRWLRFACLLPGGSTPPDAEDKEEVENWIDSAAASFCRQFRMTERFSEFWTGEETP